MNVDIKPPLSQSLKENNTPAYPLEMRGTRSIDTQRRPVPLIHRGFHFLN